MARQRALRRPAVGRDGDDRHDLQVLVELAVGEPLAAAAERVEILAHARLADVDAVERQSRSCRRRRTDSRPRPTSARST